MPETLDYQFARKRKKNKTQYVWRAARYLKPYKRLVVASIVCAIFAGGIFFGGLGAVLPVMKVLLEGDTPQMWVNRMVAEERWGIDLADDPDEVKVVEATEWPKADHVSPQVGAAEPVVFSWPNLPNTGVADQLRYLADAERADLQPDSGREPVQGAITVGWLRMEPTPRDVALHLRLLRRGAYLLPSHPVGAVLGIMGVIFLLSALANTIRFVQEFLSNKASLSAVNDIRRDLYGHALRAPLSYFGKTGTGDITSRIVGDCGQLQEGFRTLLGRAVQEPILAFFAFMFALWIDWRLTLFIIVMAPFMVVILRRFGKKMRRAGRATLAENAELLGQIEGTLSGVRVVKANNAEAAEVGRLHGVLDRLLGHQLRLAKYDAMSTPVLETLAVLALGLILAVATYFVRVDESLSATEGILVLVALVQIAESLRKISKLNIVLQRTNAAGQRVFEAIDAETETRSGEEAKSEPRERESSKFEPSPSSALRSDFAPSPLRVSDSVAFEDVTFSYADDLPPALQDVSLTVAAGESIAVVGRNGSGKTTLLSLLPLFFKPSSGRVTIDGKDIRDLPLHGLRSLIGVVTQDAHVFPGTIAHNIAYGRPEATRAEVEAAAKQAEAHEFILAKPDGYDTVLTGLGGGLSGGQRQRLNIARAILRDPPILILDEATSQVDAESEHLIQNAISRLMKGRTTFVIAHRFSTILDCDRIALMEAGKLEAVGTHDELLATSDVYRQLYERQLVAA